jgi:hypothetical protein
VRAAARRRNYIFPDLALPSRILSSTKIAKSESNGKTEKLYFSGFGTTKPHKDSENITTRQTILKTFYIIFIIVIIPTPQTIKYTILFII